MQDHKTSCISYGSYKHLKASRLDNDYYKCHSLNHPYRDTLDLFANYNKKYPVTLETENIRTKNCNSNIKKYIWLPRAHTFFLERHQDL